MDTRPSYAGWGRRPSDTGGVPPPGHFGASSRVAISNILAAERTRRPLRLACWCGGSEGLLDRRAKISAHPALDLLIDAVHLSHGQVGVAEQKILARLDELHAADLTVASQHKVPADDDFKPARFLKRRRDRSLVRYRFISGQDGKTLCARVTEPQLAYQLRAGRLLASERAPRTRNTQHYQGARKYRSSYFRLVPDSIVPYCIHGRVAAVGATTFRLLKPAKTESVA